ncbi:MAG: lysophospholipid acyltransferase family protein, partial [Candidatus Aminicenantia bacterium]
MERIILWIKAFITRITITLLCKTVKIKLIGQENYLKAKRDGKKIISILWHGRIIIPIYVHRKQKIRPLVSLSRDGEFASMVLKGFGYEPIRGSSSKGGREAFQKMKDALENSVVAIIPDGPRGPGRVLKPGCLYLALQTGAVIIPLSFSCKKKKLLKGWDKHLIFPPFNKCFMVYGEPISVSQDLSTEELESLRIQVEKKLIEMDEEADKLASTNENISY